MKDLVATMAGYRKYWLGPYVLVLVLACLHMVFGIDRPEIPFVYAVF